MLDFNSYQVLTFDCYGTLIDWETGILTALRPVLAAHEIAIADHEVLRLYAELEASAESDPLRRYSEVLRRVVDGMGYMLRFTPSATEAGCLADSIGRWPPFPDTLESLRRLQARYRLGIISNVDDDLFAQTAKLLDIGFDWVITAEQAQSYKPSLNNFRLALGRIGVPKEQVLHVAESIRHDIVPARLLGLSAVWVNRSKGMGRTASASGASSNGTSEADLEVPDLKTLVSLMGLF
jgi:2-haloacid dehalogenase